MNLVDIIKSHILQPHPSLPGQKSQQEQPCAVHFILHPDILTGSPIFPFCLNLLKLSGLFQSLTSTEKESIALERIVQYLDVDQEQGVTQLKPRMKMKNVQLETPAVIEFRNVKLSYDDD